MISQLTTVKVGQAMHIGYHVYVMEFETYFFFYFDWNFQTLTFRQHAARSMNACVSIYMLVLLSIDRYVAIVLSIKRNRIYEWARNIRKSIFKLNMLCMLTWFLAIMTSYPVTSRVKVAEDGTNMCGTDWGTKFYREKNLSCRYKLNPLDLVDFDLKMNESECRNFLANDAQLAQDISHYLAVETMNECACTKSLDQRKFTVIYFVATYAIPLTTITFCYMNIVYVLRQSTTRNMNKTTKKD